MHTARCEGLSKHHARHPITHQTMLRAAELHRVHTAAGQGVHARLQELDPPRGGQTLRRVLLGSRVQLRTCRSGLFSVLRQLLLSFLHTAAQNADNLQHQTAGWRFIDWNEVEQRELLKEAKRLLETGELFPRGIAEEPHAPDAEAEATDSDPEAHVMEPLAEDPSSDGEDTPTGVEESAAPAVTAALCLRERLQRIRVVFSSKPPT